MRRRAPTPRAETGTRCFDKCASAARAKEAARRAWRGAHPLGISIRGRARGGEPAVACGSSSPRMRSCNSARCAKRGAVSSSRGCGDAPDGMALAIRPSARASAKGRSKMAPAANRANAPTANLRSRKRKLRFTSHAQAARWVSNHRVWLSKSSLAASMIRPDCLKARLARAILASTCSDIRDTNLAPTHERVRGRVQEPTTNERNPARLRKRGVKGGRMYA